MSKYENEVRAFMPYQAYTREEFVAWVRKKFEQCDLKSVKKFYGVDKNFTFKVSKFDISDFYVCDIHISSPDTDRFFNLGSRIDHLHELYVIENIFKNGLVSIFMSPFEHRKPDFDNEMWIHFEIFFQFEDNHKRLINGFTIPLVYAMCKKLYEVEQQNQIYKSALESKSKRKM